MKTLAPVAALLMSAPTPAPAQDSQLLCTKLGELAEQVMILRQKEHPISDLMANVPDGPTGEMFAKMIIAAYEQPSYSTLENQQDAIEEFRNDWELQCYTVMAN